MYPRFRTPPRLRVARLSGPQAHRFLRSVQCPRARALETPALLLRHLCVALPEFLGRAGLCPLCTLAVPLFHLPRWMALLVFPEFVQCLATCNIPPAKSIAGILYQKLYLKHTYWTLSAGAWLQPCALTLPAHAPVRVLYLQPVLLELPCAPPHVRELRLLLPLGL